MPPKRRTSPLKREKEAPSGLTWPGFRSWYKEAKGTSDGVSEAWDAYKKKHGIVPKVSAKKKVSPPKKANKKVPKKEELTYEDFEYNLRIKNSKDIDPKKISSFWQDILHVFEDEYNKRDVEIVIIKLDKAHLSLSVEGTNAFHKKVTSRVTDLINEINTGKTYKATEKIVRERILTIRKDFPKYKLEVEVLIDAGKVVKKEPEEEEPEEETTESEEEVEEQRTFLLSVDVSEKTTAFNAWSKFSTEFSKHVGNNFTYTLESVKDDPSVRELLVPARETILKDVKKAIETSNKKLDHKVTLITSKKETEEKLSARKKSPEVEQGKAKITVNVTVGEFDSDENELVDLGKALSPKEINEVIEALKTTLVKRLSYIDSSYRGPNFTVRYSTPKISDTEIKQILRIQFLPGNGSIQGTNRSLGFFKPELVNVERAKTPPPKKPLPKPPAKKRSPPKRPLPKPPAKKTFPPKKPLPKPPTKKEELKVIYDFPILLGEVTKSRKNADPVVDLDIDTSDALSTILTGIIESVAGSGSVQSIKEDQTFNFIVSVQTSARPEDIILAIAEVSTDGISVDNRIIIFVPDTEKFEELNETTLDFSKEEKKDVSGINAEVVAIKSKSKSRTKSPVKPTKSLRKNRRLYELKYPVTAREEKGNKYEDVGDTLSEAEVQLIFDFINSRKIKNVSIVGVQQEGNTIIVDVETVEGKTKMTKAEVETAVSDVISGRRIKGDGRMLKL